MSVNAATMSRVSHRRNIDGMDQLSCEHRYNRYNIKSANSHVAIVKIMSPTYLLACER